MNQKAKITLAIIGIAVILATYLMYLYRDMLNEFPPGKDFYFDNLAFAVPDAHNNLYLIDQSLRRLVKISKDGQIKNIMLAKKGDSKTTHRLTEVVADANGYMYILNTYLDSRGYYVLAEEITRHDEKGRLDQTLYRIDYNQDNRPIWVGRLKTLHIKDGFLYFYDTYTTTVYLNRLPLDGGSKTTILTFNIPPDTYLSTIAGTNPGSIFYTTKKGNINRFDNLGTSELIYSEAMLDSSGQKSLPVNLDVDDKNNVYFADIGKAGICILKEKIPQPAAAEIMGLTNENTGNQMHAYLGEEILSTAKLYGQGFDIPFSDFKSIKISQDGLIVAVVSDQVIGIRADGTVDFILDGAVYPAGMQAGRWLIICLPVLILILLIIAFRLIYIDVLKRRISLMLKQILVITPLFITAMLIISGLFQSFLDSQMEKEMYSKLKLMTRFGAQTITGDMVEKINKPQDFMNSDYRIMRDKVRNMFSEQGNSKYYVVIYKVDREKLYICLTDDDSKSPYYPVEWDEAFSSVMQGNIVTDWEPDPDGSWMYAIGPIYNSLGQVVGQFETGIDKNGFNLVKNNLFVNIGKSILVMTLITILIFALMSYFMLKAIRQLHKGVAEVAGGNWDTVITINTRDEVEDLSDGFNTMSGNIRKFIEKITALSESYFRFVPQQILTYLNKEAITDVQLGDQLKQEMCIFFSSIREFHDISKKLTPEENFKLINSYLSRIGPIIRKHGGFINKYLGAGIMALFPGSPEKALKAAIDIRKELVVYNRHRRNSGYGPLEIGIGIHRGPLMLGIVGEEKRLEGAVISDNVNLSEALEKVSPKLGSYILVTDKMLVRFGDRFEHRYLGRMHLEGKAQPVKIYEVFQADPEDLRNLKLDTRELFEEGVMLYQDGKFYDARSNFVEVVRRNFRDEAAKIYFFLCDEYFKNGAPEGWDGNLSFTSGTDYSNLLHK